MKIEPDIWLGSVFGLPVYRITDSDPLPNITTESLVSHAENGRSFYFIKVPVTDIKRVNAFCNAGFRVVDVNVTYEGKPDQLRPPEPDIGIRIRKYHTSDKEAVLDIAGSCFEYSRFHLDPHIPKELADRVKREWVANYIKGHRGNDLFVAEFNGRTIGFNAVLTIVLQDSQVRVIDLIGVDRPFQHRGAGKKLLEHFIHESFGKCSLLRVGTQIANIPSMRLYTHFGFYIVEAAYVLHAHVKNGEVVQ